MPPVVGPPRTEAALVSHGTGLTAFQTPADVGRQFPLAHLADRAGHKARVGRRDARVRRGGLATTDRTAGRIEEIEAVDSPATGLSAKQSSQFSTHTRTAANHGCLPIFQYRFQAVSCLCAAVVRPKPRLTLPTDRPTLCRPGCRQPETAAPGTSFHRPPRSQSVKRPCSSTATSPGPSCTRS